MTTKCDKIQAYSSDHGIGAVCLHCGDFLEWNGDLGVAVFWCICHAPLPDLEWLSLDVS